jgi:hypothetical protein
VNGEERCPVEGCQNSVDPRSMAHAADGRVVGICDAHPISCPAPDGPCTCPPIAAGAGGPSAWHEAQRRRKETR